MPTFRHSHCLDSAKGGPDVPSAGGGAWYWRWVVALMIALALTVPATPADAEAPDAPRPGPKVVVSYYPLYVMALNVMQGIEPAPTLLMEPAGGCAHGLSLRPSQVVVLREAGVIVETGLGLEPFLENDRLPLNRGARRVPVAAGIPDEELIALAHDHADHEDDAGRHEEQGHEGHAHEHDHEEAHGEAESAGEFGSREGFNGHAWSSPRLCARMTRTLGAALAEHDPENADRYLANAAAYAERLEQLDKELRAAAAPLGRARVVASHTSLAYLIRDMNGIEAATLRDEDENEPGPRGFGRLVSQVREAGIDGVLYDPQDEGRLSRAFAAEVDCDRVILLDPAASGELDAEGYVNIMKRNIKAIQAWGRGSAEDDGEFEPLAMLPNTHSSTGEDFAGKLNRIQP